MAEHSRDWVNSRCFYDEGEVQGHHFEDSTITSHWTVEKWKCPVFGRVRLFCDPMDCSLPGSSIHGILQAEILGWVAILSSGDLPNPRAEPPVSQIANSLYHLTPQQSSVVEETQQMLTSLFLSFNFLPKPVRMGKMKKKGLWWGRSFWGNDSCMFSPWKGLTIRHGDRNRSMQWEIRWGKSPDFWSQRRGFWITFQLQRWERDGFSIQLPGTRLGPAAHTSPRVFFFWLKCRFWPSRLGPWAWGSVCSGDADQRLISVRVGAAHWSWGSVWGLDLMKSSHYPLWYPIERKYAVTHKGVLRWQGDPSLFLSFKMQSYNGCLVSAPKWKVF